MSAEQFAQCGERLRDNAVVSPAAAAFPLDETCVAEHLEVVTDGRLAQTERLREVTHARFATRLRLNEAEEA